MTALVHRYRGVVCDLDGVAFRGKDPVTDASASLQRLLDDGMPVRFATNNASRLPGVVGQQLRDLGIRTDDHGVLTSSQASATQLARDLAPGSRVLAIGGEGVSAALAEAGLAPVLPAQLRESREREQDDAVAAVLQGYGAQVTAADLLEAARAVHFGARWIATNPDLTLPNEWGAGPGCGAFVQVVATAVGHGPDEVIGKPFPPLYLECASQMDLAPRDILAIGDRLDTDIDGAANAGMDSLWVMTGVDQVPALLTGPSHRKPTYVMTTLAGLQLEYAEPRRVDGVAGSQAQECDGLRVRLHSANGEWDVSGAGPTDPWRRANAVLRAGLAVLVALRDEGSSEDLEAAANSLMDRVARLC